MSAALGLPLAGFEEFTVYVFLEGNETDSLNFNSTSKTKHSNVNMLKSFLSRKKIEN